jgi:hypothetical protein
MFCDLQYISAHKDASGFDLLKRHLGAIKMEEIVYVPN